MAGRPPTDPELVAEALRRVEAGQHRDDVARDLTAAGRTISVATIRRAQDAARKTAAASTPTPAPAATKKPAKGPRAAKAPPEVKAPPPPPPPIPLLPDAIAEVRAALELTKGQLAASAGKHGYGQIGNLYDKLLKTLGALERERAKPGTDLAEVLAKGDVAIAKVESGFAAIARREADTGCCEACGARLSEEALVERRGLAAA